MHCDVYNLPTYPSIHCNCSFSSFYNKGYSTYCVCLCDDDDDWVLKSWDLVSVEGLKRVDLLFIFFFLYFMCMRVNNNLMV